MKDSDLFKKLKFNGSDAQKENENSWLRKLEAIENLLSFELPLSSETFSSAEADLSHDFPLAKLLFRLEFDPVTTDSTHIQSTSCTLHLYQQLLDNSNLTLQPITSRETLDVLTAQENRLSSSDLAWIQAFQPYLITPSHPGELRVLLPPAIQAEVLQELCVRQILFSFDPEPAFFSWADFDRPAPFFLQLRQDHSTTPERWKVWGRFETPIASIDLWEIQGVTQGGVARKGNLLFAFSLSSPDGGPLYPWIQVLLTGGAIHFPKFALSEFLYRTFQLLDQKVLDLPQEVYLESVSTPVQPLFYVKTQFKKRTLKTQIEAFVWFRVTFSPSHPTHSKAALFEYPSEIHKDIGTQTRPKVLRVHQDYDRNNDRFQVSIWVPDLAFERVRLEEVQHCLGISFDSLRRSFQLELSQATEIFYFLLNHGWELWAENLQIKILKEFEIQITTHQNWFDLNIDAGKPPSRISAWQLIHMLKKKRMFIQLSDGSLGILPENWYKEFERLFSLRCPDSDSLRFSMAHAFHLTEMAELASEETSATVKFWGDPAFEQLRQEILNLKGLKPMTAPPSFNFTLRPYQELGLSWMHFLGRTRLGGCLADDMGLGKTTQLLAYLDQKRFENSDPGNRQPRFRSLLVCPKSLLEHWFQEAQKCAPKLKILILKSSEIVQLESLLEHFDLFLISYGLVRLHATELQKYTFDLLALDEAQIVKNSGAQVSLSVKQLRGTQRLALTGTPIENHMGELFSLFEFLNPGITHPSLLKNAGSNPGLVEAPDNGGSTDSASNPFLAQFLRGIRPLILRRMKEEVATELPEKSEQTLVLPMNEGQESIYTSLKNYYREELQKLKKQDPAQNLFYEKSFFLEGLLRLRQASCHPALLAGQLTSSPDQGTETPPEFVSNKFEFLMDKLRTLIAAGHKAIIFSQFTSLLKLFRNLLNSEAIPYEYLDGQSEDRMEIVNRFQDNPEIPILLAGIRTGGLGLNLTAADYCFILDPGWNPAVEQQAVDRIHRIGQNKPVSIYRIVSQNTVEEKMTLLQQEKQKIADQLITADHAFLQSLSYDDFQFLFN